MSRYQSSTTRLARYSLAQTAAVRGVMATSPTTLCSSTQLSSLAVELAGPASSTGPSVSLSAAAELVADQRLTLLAATAGPQTTARLDAVRVQLTAGVAALHAPDIAGLFTDLAPRLAREERAVVVTGAVDTLDSSGYTVIHESGPAADGIEARRGDEVMLLAVTDGGEISVDHVGVDGACADRQARFEAGMAARGIAMDQRAVTPHPDDEGPLVTAAAARSEASLARAVARHTKARSAPAPARSAPARRRARTATPTVAGEST